jgi:benzodiazapine receptor
MKAEFNNKIPALYYGAYAPRAGKSVYASLDELHWKYSEVTGKYCGCQFWSERAKLLFESSLLEHVNGKTPTLKDAKGVAKFLSTKARKEFQLVHEHVFPRAELRKLLDRESSLGSQLVAETVQRLAIGCVVLECEHRLVNKTKGDSINPWRRYTGKIRLCPNQNWSASHLELIKDAGLLGPPTTSGAPLVTMSELSLPSSPRRNSALALAGFLAATFLVAGVSTTFTISAIPTWYAALAKPSFNPPDNIFGPVWTLLYTLMAIAAWLVWKLPDVPFRRGGVGVFSIRRVALIWFGIQLTVNFLWSFVFFGHHKIGLSVVEIAFLWLAVAGTMILFFRLSKAASWLFVPYLAWVSFASVLNFAIWRLN